MKPIAAIFDLDGVIVETAQFHFQAWKKIAATLGHELTHAQNEQLKGVSRVDSLEKILHWSGATLTMNQFDSLLVRKNEDYLKLIEALSPKDTLPGVVRCMTILQEAGIKIALGSASKNARKILEQLALTDFFDAIIDGNDTQVSKPDPEVFLKGAKALKVAPENCIVFEDAQAGIAAARAAKMIPIGVGSPEVLDQAWQCIPGFAQLTETQLLRFFDTV
ncbi:MAG: beta-phosphoglucomutase [Flavobacteriaceae bacterium]